MAVAGVSAGPALPAPAADGIGGCCKDEGEHLVELVELVGFATEQAWPDAVSGQVADAIQRRMTWARRQE